MKKITVLGVGNRIMGDDGIGVRIVEALAQDVTMRNFHFAAGETDIDYCLGELEDADRCIIIDASCFGKEPCSIAVQDLKDVFSQRRPACTFHDFDLIHGMKLRDMRKEGILITIEAGFIGFSADLSPLMQERFEEIVREVKVKIYTEKHCQNYY